MNTAGDSFKATLEHNNKKYTLAPFATAEEAARAYDAKSVALGRHPSFSNFE